MRKELSIFISVFLLCVEVRVQDVQSSSLQEPEYKNSCTPQKCVQCNYDRDAKQLYCIKCLNSKLIGTAPYYKDGSCEGDTTKIDNCLVTSFDDKGVKCSRCGTGYQLTPQGTCTTTTIENCVVTNDNKDYVTCLACNPGFYPLMPLNNICVSIPYFFTDTSLQIIDCIAYDTDKTCYLCNPQYGRNDERNQCIFSGGGINRSCYPLDKTLGTREGRPICKQCDFFSGYASSVVIESVRISGNNAQICKSYFEVKEITLEKKTTAKILKFFFLPVLMTIFLVGN